MQQNLPNLKPGDVVAGRFRLVEVIGSGGFSVVYRAYHDEMSRFVALKLLKPSAMLDNELVERFRREAFYASHLSHPHTITLFDYGHTRDGLCYIAMEYLEGVDLSEVVSIGKPVDLKRVWKVLYQTAQSLAEAHHMGLVHRDLKPENIFLVQRNDEEFVKVLDFGVSKAVSQFADAGPQTLAPLTQDGVVFGTPLYMAPEQAMAHPVTPASDIYALGHIAFEMITGSAAYAELRQPMEVMLRQINDPPLELPHPWEKTPFFEVVRRCTQKDPQQRYKSAEELLEALCEEAFIPFMTTLDRRERVPTTPEVLAITSSPHVTPELSQEDVQVLNQSVKNAYGNELKALHEALREVETTGQMRLVVIDGIAGSGRSNLLRAFLRHERRRARSRILHRPMRSNAWHDDEGLECELAELLREPLKEQGLEEIYRLIHIHDGEGDLSSQSLQSEARADTSPISWLSSMRDRFLQRLGRPFYEAAKQAPLIWGIENLEQVDTLSLAFLNFLFRRLQVEPAPVLLILTVSQRDILQRPGILRYAQQFLESNHPCIRQLQLINPHALPSNESNNARTVMLDMQSIPLRGTLNTPVLDDDTLEDQSVLSRQLAKAIRIKEAIDAQLLASEEAYRASDFDSARESYLKIRALLEQYVALEIVQQESEMPAFVQKLTICEIWFRVGEVHGALGEHGAAEDALNNAISTAAANQQEIVGRAHKRLAELAISQKNYLLAVHCYEKARDIFRRAKMMQAYVTVVGEIGYCALMLGRAGQAEEILLQALSKAQELSERVIIARIHRHLGKLLSKQARFAEARRHFDLAMVEFECLCRDTDVMECLIELGNLSIAQEEYEQARESLTLALALCSTQYEMPTQLPHLSMARALAAMNQIDQALECLFSALDICTAHRALFRQVELHWYIGDAFLANEALDQAHIHYEKAIRYAQNIGYIPLVCQVLIRQGYLCFERENTTEAYEKLSRAVSLAQSIEDFDTMMQARAHIVYLQLLEHNFQIQGAAFSELLKQCAQKNLHSALLLCKLFRVDVIGSQGSYKQALSMLDEVLESAAEQQQFEFFVAISIRKARLEAFVHADQQTAEFARQVVLGALIPPESLRRKVHYEPV